MLAFSWLADTVIFVSPQRIHWSQTVFGLGPSFFLFFVTVQKKEFCKLTIFLQSAVIFSITYKGGVNYGNDQNLPHTKLGHMPARRQDLAVGGPKTRRGAHIFKIQCWMYVAIKGPNVKWGGTDFKWGTGHHWPPRWRRPWTYGWTIQNASF